MIHPSYTDLMEVVNSEVEPGEQPVVQSRYSIVLATAKRARQIIAGDEPLIRAAGKKPLSVAVEELYEGQVKIVGDEEDEDEDVSVLTEHFPQEEISAADMAELLGQDGLKASETAEAAGEAENSEVSDVVGETEEASEAAGETEEEASDAVEETEETGTSD